MAKKGVKPLFDYEARRDFSRTPEPAPGKGKYRGGLFVVQKHGARALHYDLRLELGGVLKSWAVPKGPSLDPGERRLSVRVEDHPMDYAGFEGMIPKGEYGGGTVIIWDRGFWMPAGSPGEGLEKGSLKFYLFGEKLRGGWALARSRTAEDGKEEWLLIKEQDEDAAAGEITEEMPESVLSGLTLEEVAGTPAGVWSEKGGIRMPEPRPMMDAVEKAMQRSVRPELATLVDKPPGGGGWLHEIKLDGYRILARIDEGSVVLYTRAGNDWTAKFPSVAQRFSRLPLRSAWIDGEVVFMKEDGTTSFEGVQTALSEGDDSSLDYFAFDIVYYNGYDISSWPLADRKKFLKYILKAGKDAGIRFSEHVEGKGGEFFSNACRYGLEGVVSKKADARYFQGRSASWLKTKCHLSQEFVVGGYTEAKGSRYGFGALLTGVYDKKGRLLYTGRVGTGFNEETLKQVWERLKRTKAQRPPFINPPSGPEAKGVHWTRPGLVVEVEFGSWTRDGVMRHPSFKGIRDDKPPAEVLKEEPGTQKEEGKTGRPKAAELPVRLTSPSKIYYPQEGYNKRDLAEYYAAVSRLMLPHLKDRPLTLLRCPEGYEKGCFFQKHTEAGLPKELKRIKIKEDEGHVETYLTADSLEALLGLVQMGTLEIHTMGCRYANVENPDKITFDMDPDPEVEWGTLVEAAYLLRGVLSELGLRSFVKATGGKGLHVVVPLEPSAGWEEVKLFTRYVAEFIAKGLPGRFTSKMTKTRRKGKIFLDYMRNIRGATAIEVYSTRAKKGAPIAAPLSWDEIGAVRSDTFNIGNIRERLSGLRKDPWAGYFEVRQKITKEMMERVG